MPPLIIEEEMDEMDSGDKYNDEPMPTEMLEDISDGSKYRPSVNMREARYVIALNKDKLNGKDHYYLRKIWVKFYKKRLKLP